MAHNLSPSEWNDFVTRSAGNSFLQSWEWAEFQKALGVNVQRLVCGKDEVTGLGLALERKLPTGSAWLYFPRGPVIAEPSYLANWQAFQHEALALAYKNEYLFLRSEPVLPLTHSAILKSTGWRKAGNDVQPRHTLVLDLRKSEEHLQAQMHQKTRYNIRLAEKKGLTCRFSTDPKDIEIFLKLSQDVSDRSEFHYHPDEYYRTMAQVLGKAGLLEVAVAEREGVALAAHILISFGGITTYAHGASSSAHRALMGPHLLQWQSILRAKQRGDHTYDFYGVAPESKSKSEADAHPWAGITRFKLGFGGTRVAYLGAYDYILKPAQYLIFNTARRLRSVWR